MTNKQGDKIVFGPHPGKEGRFVVVALRPDGTAYAYVVDDKGSAAVHGYDPGLDIEVGE